MTDKPRTEEQIIAEDIISQEHLDFIREKQKLIDKGENGITAKEILDAKYQILQARTAIKNRVLAIQTKENVDIGFSEATAERKKNSQCIDKVEKELKEHIDDSSENPTLFAILKKKPLRALSIITGIYLVYFTIFHMILYFSGFQAFIDWLMP